MVKRWNLLPVLLGAFISPALVPQHVWAQFPIVADDIAVGLSNSDPTLTLDVVRGPREEYGGGSEGGYWDVASIQSVEFDNLGGLSHNPAGNLLGLNFGSSSTGGTIYSLATTETATPVSQLIGDMNGLGGSGLTLTRMGGLSVSPNNSKIAVTGYDSGRVLVFDYAAGDGMGGAASLSGGRETSDGIVGVGDTQGSTWLNDSTVLAFNVDGSLVGVDANTMSASTLVQVPTGGGPDVNRSEYTDVEYNPAIAPYIYLSYGSFDRDLSTAMNLLFVVDPTDFSLVKTVDLTDSIDSMREIALDTAGNLIFTQFTGGGGLPFLEVLLGASDPASLTDGSSIDFTAADARASFSGLDVALGIPVVTPGLLGDFDQSGSLDIADIDALTAAVMVGTDLSFDVNTDGALNDDDRKYWIGTLKNTYTGDANLDGEFGSGDLVTVFSAGLYETGNAAGWAQGDWNGDGQFDTGDLVAAFSEGGYEAGPKAAVAAVPEPASWVILASAFCLLPLRRRG